MTLYRIESAKLSKTYLYKTFSLMKECLESVILDLDDDCKGNSEVRVDIYPDATLPEGYDEELQEYVHDR